MARQIKETASNRVMAAARITPLQDLGMVGRIGSEAEETEEAEPFEPALEKPVLTEREETFKYLKEFRRRKRLKQKLERECRAREEMRIEMDRVLQEDAERSARETEEL